MSRERTMRCRGMGCCALKLKPMPAARRTPSGHVCIVGGPMRALILCSSSICTQGTGFQCSESLENVRCRHNITFQTF